MLLFLIYDTLLYKIINSSVENITSHQLTVYLTQISLTPPLATITRVDVRMFYVFIFSSPPTKLSFFRVSPRLIIRTLSCSFFLILVRKFLFSLLSSLPQYRLHRRTWSLNILWWKFNQRSSAGEILWRWLVAESRFEVNEETFHAHFHDISTLIEKFSLLFFTSQNFSTSETAKCWSHFTHHHTQRHFKVEYQIVASS